MLMRHMHMGIIMFIIMAALRFIIVVRSFPQ